MLQKKGAITSQYFNQLGSRQSCGDWFQPAEIRGVKDISSSPAAPGGEMRAGRCEGPAALSAGQELSYCKSGFFPHHGPRELHGITPRPQGVWQLMETEYFYLLPAISEHLIKALVLKNLKHSLLQAYTDRAKKCGPDPVSTESISWSVASSDVTSPDIWKSAESYFWTVSLLPREINATYATGESQRTQSFK